MPLTQNPLALHTWSLDTTSLPDLLRIARSTGRDAVELRRVDFDRAEAAGQSEAQVMDLLRDSGLPVSAVGVTFGWMFAYGADLDHLLATFERSCVAAAALRCSVVMSPVDKDRGDVARAAEGIRRVGDIAARYGVKVALEFNSQAAQFNTLESVREVLDLAAHPGAACCWIRTTCSAAAARAEASPKSRPKRSRTSSSATCRAPAWNLAIRSTRSAGRG